MIAVPVHAESISLPAVIIHQIRGNETCCEPGNTEIFEVVSQDETLRELSLSWALRFDALKDDKLMNQVKQLPKNHTLGILLEVTPELASQSGVIYKNGSWKSARNVFLLGYTQGERKQLIDTVFGSFHSQFAYYPSFTVAWMIDSWSLEYLRSTYGVRVHELTKEQFETDSYTLYGGIFNMPYFPQKTHPLFPGNEANTLDLLIFRQTVSDIGKNYGSYKSFYTSQPNDYLSNPQQTDFSYFQDLISQMIQQDTHDQFAVLGIENSKEWATYKDEYLKQLQWIYEKQKAGEIILRSPLEMYHDHKNRSADVSYRVLKSNTFPEAGAWWYMGNHYRARLEKWNDQLILTDLRIYPSLKDPYRELPLSASQAYWIAPYLIDSSQQFKEIRESPLLYQGNPVRRDSGVERFGLILKEGTISDIKKTKDTVTFSYEFGEVIFSPHTIEIKDTGDLTFSSPISLSATNILEEKVEKYFTFPRHPRFFLKPTSSHSIDVGWESRELTQIPLAEMRKTDTGWKINMNVSLDHAEINDLSMIFQPDRSAYHLDPAKTTLYWHNTEAIAGRSPIRLYIDPRNVLERPVSIRQFSVQLDEGDKIIASYPTDTVGQMEPFFVDFIASESASGKTRFLLDGNIFEGEVLQFYNNCRKDPLFCMNNKDQLKGYLTVSFREYQDEMGRKWQEFKKSYLTQVEDWLKNPEWPPIFLMQEIDPAR